MVGGWVVGENWVSSKVGRWVGRWVAGWAGMWAGRQAGRRVGSIGAPSGEIIDFIKRGFLLMLRLRNNGLAGVRTIYITMIFW